jgi:hypothetical protein
MEFTYKIKNYIQSEKRLFVIYTPTDKSLPVWGGWVQIDDNMTEAEIKECVIQSLPTYRWENAEIAAAKNLVNHSETVTYQAPQPSVFPQPDAQPDAEQIARSRRNRQLSLSDWAILPDSPLSDATKAEYVVYRQALRDVPEQSGFPDSIVWPTRP